MSFEIRKMSPSLANDYIKFFESSAFCDGSEFAGCYCTWYNWNDDLEDQRAKCCEAKRKSFKKDLAYKWVSHGYLNGFLSYHDGVPVGWCNADDKRNYDRLSKDNNPEIWLRHEDRVLSVVCFVVSPDMRGKGVATALLGEACRYAKASGCKYVEGYPHKGEFSDKNYHGQYSTYEKLGFQPICDSKMGLVMRKHLS